MIPPDCDPSPVTLAIEYHAANMALQPPENDTDSWNPALLPEDSQGTYANALPEGGLAIAHDSKETALTDAKSPQSDEDFSAWDMSDETGTAQPQYTSMDGLVSTMSPGVDAAPSSDVPPIETQSSDTVTPVAAEPETFSESAFMREATSSTNNETAEFVPESVSAESNDKKRRPPWREIPPPNEAPNAASEDPWGLMEADNGNVLSGVVPSTEIPLASSEPAIAAQPEDNHEPAFVADPVIQTHEQTVVPEPALEASDDVLPTTENLPLSENPQTSIQSEPVDHPTSAPNDTHLSQQAVNPETPTDTQSPWPRT